MTESLSDTSLFTASVSTLAAILSAICAFLSYGLARTIQNELRSDERIIIGPFQHPESLSEDHVRSVIVCMLFNKSRRKAYVEAVRANDDSCNEIRIKWSSSIDKCGNVEKPYLLMGIVDSSPLYIRRADGEPIEDMLLFVTHSFSESPEVIRYSELIEDSLEK